MTLFCHLYDAIAYLPPPERRVKPWSKVQVVSSKDCNTYWQYIGLLKKNGRSNLIVFNGKTQEVKYHPLNLFLRIEVLEEPPSMPAQDLGHFINLILNNVEGTTARKKVRQARTITTRSAKKAKCCRDVEKQKAELEMRVKQMATETENLQKVTRVMMYCY